ncbi:MAG: hypothetical protein IPI19_07435 [Ignavibacteriales bacterium]|nr:hypothetical protein [Ignavibacteriales bacterium]
MDISISGKLNVFYLCFTDLNNGWIVGDQGKILNTNNGGANWDQLSVTTKHLTSLSFKDDSNIGTSWDMQEQ